MNAFTTGGRVLWRRYFGSFVYSSPAVWHGRVFFGTYGGTFYALSAANGSTLWAVPTGGSVSGAAVVVDGVAYAGSFAHRIVGVDALTGRVVLTFPHGEYVPVSGGGQRLLLHGYSRLYAVAER
jgi:outer membrane protein assembly factor BamB